MFSAQLRAPLPDPTLSGEQDPTMPGGPTLQGIVPGLPCAAAETKGSTMQRSSQTFESSNRLEFGRNEGPVLG